MNPELITAIKERLALGRAPETIREELKQTGYDESSIEQALTIAQREGSESAGRETLPGLGELFSIGWKFTTRYIDLVVWLTLPLLIITLIEQVPGAEVAVGLGTVVALVVYMVLAMAALRIVTLDTGVQKITISSVLPWVRNNIGGLIWISVLTMLVVGGGFLLLVIPAIVVSFSVYLAQFVYVQEGARGMKALLRSRELVKGQWWAVFARLVGLMLIFFAGLFSLGVIVGMIALLVSAEGTLEDRPIVLLFDLLSQVLSALMTMIGLKVGFTLFECLQEAKPSGATTAKGKGVYLSLAWLGVLCLLMFGAFFQSESVKMQDWRLDSVEEGGVSAEQAKQRAIELRKQAD